MVPTDHDIPFSRTFQGLLRYIFKDFSVFFVLSNIHLRKNDQQWTFQIRHRRDHLSLPEKWWRGGGGFVYVFLTFLDDLLYYCYNTGSNNSA